MPEENRGPWSKNFENRWSYVFCIGSGVRQAGVLSPALLNVFINIVLTRLQTLGVGCWVQQLYVGCLLYADDIILLCPTLTGLLLMLCDCCGIEFAV